jgi:hypothetical protein
MLKKILDYEVSDKHASLFTVVKVNTLWSAGLNDIKLYTAVILECSE